MVTDEEIERLEKEHPDVCLLPPRKPRIIWEDDCFDSYYTSGGCDYYDVREGDCPHREGWHCIPAQVRTGDMGLYFEIRRRRPDGEPSEEWSLMTPEERRRVMAMWIRDHIGSLLYPVVRDA